MVDKTNPKLKSFADIEAESRRRRVADRLEMFREQYDAGDPFAAYSTLVECEESSEPLPSWLNEKIKPLLKLWMSDTLPPKPDGRKPMDYIHRTRWHWCRLIIGLQKKENTRRANVDEKADEKKEEIIEPKLIDPAEAFACPTNLPDQILDAFHADENLDLGTTQDEAFEIVSRALKIAGCPAAAGTVRKSFRKIESSRSASTGVPIENFGQWYVSDRVLIEHGITPIPFSFDKYTPVTLPLRLMVIYLHGKVENDCSDFLNALPLRKRKMVSRLLGR